MTKSLSVRPKFGSFDYFVSLYRPGSAAEVDVLACMSGCIAAILEDGNHTDAEKVAHVRNALAAAELLRAEMRQRDGDVR